MPNFLCLSYLDSHLSSFQCELLDLEKCDAQKIQLKSFQKSDETGKQNWTKFIDVQRKVFIRSLRAEMLLFFVDTTAAWRFDLWILIQTFFKTTFLLSKKKLVAISKLDNFLSFFIYNIYIYSVGTFFLFSDEVIDDAVSKQSAFQDIYLNSDVNYCLTLLRRPLLNLIFWGNIRWKLYSFLYRAMKPPSIFITNGFSKQISN